MDDDDPDATIIVRRPRPEPAPPPEPVAKTPESDAELSSPEPIAETPVPASEPPAPDQVLEPIADIPPLRDAVLAGAYFGAIHRETVEQFAAFLAGASKPLTVWFGTQRGRALAGEKTSLLAALDHDIAAIDALISAQLDAILHHARLRRLEGAWRGLAWLTSRMSIGGRVKLRILNVSWAEICRDLERAAEFDQSQLFRGVYEDEFGIAGGEPYGLLVVDHEVRHRPGPGAITDDISALASLAGVAAAAFAPVVVTAAPALFGVDEFAELSGVADPTSGMNAAEYQRWRGLANREDIRFLAIGMPRTLARLPWDEALDRHRGFRYRETAVTTADRVWSGPGYMVAACVIRAFETFSWPADMRGYDVDRLGGGIAEDLPEPMFSVDPAFGLERSALEIMLTDRQERALVAAGLLPIGSLPYGGQALLGAARSLQTPGKYLGFNVDVANANAKLSAQFNTMICVSRFAHYIKVMGRDMVGSFQTADAIQRHLQTWLMRYASANVSAGSDTMAKYPLRDAQVTISETPGKPGVFGCVIQLQPHFQLDDIAASFRLMTEIAAPGSRRN
jgi:type VI secretion system protein ImpD/type VI secretion system protein ImpC